MPQSRALRLTLFGVLYFAQGAMMSYILALNILYLEGYGYGEADVGIFHSILAVPFVLKIFLGMLSDRVNLLGLGHRRPYIVIGLVLQGGVMFALALVPVADGLTLFAALALVAAVGMSLYDTCTDGYALDVTPDEDLGAVQGIMVGARAAGALLLLVVGAWIAEHLGWRWVFWLVAVLALLPVPLVLVLREGERSPEAVFRWRAFRAFGGSAVLLLAGIGLIYSVAIDGTNTFLSLHLKKGMSVSVSMVGVIIALGMGGRILGALTSAWVTDRIGQKRSLWLAVALSSVGSVALAMSQGVVLMAVAGVLFGLAYGYYTAAYAAVAMRLSDPRIAASMFAIFMMFVNLGTVGGQSLGGILTEEIGFHSMCLVMGAINLVNVALVFGVFRRGGGSAEPPPSV